MTALLPRTDTREMTMVQAVNDALALALERDPSVIVFGEDVGMGGVFRATVDLQARFGEARVFDTPLTESGIVGGGIGLALGGLKPVAELQFAGFVYPALDHVLSHLGRFRHRSRGRYTLPMVIRAPYGGGIHAPEHHADSPEGILASVPGVKVVIPSTPTDAKGLLLAAIEDPDPVFMLESIKLYRSVKEDVPTGYFTTPLGQARVVREGADCTVIAYGGMVEIAMQAAEAASSAGIFVEVLDLRSLVPLDVNAIGSSLTKTGRVVIVQEAAKTMGFAAEVSATIAERFVDVLESPIVRVAGWDAPYPPYTTIEQFYRPDARRVAEGIKKAMEF